MKFFNFRNIVISCSILLMTMVSALESCKYSQGHTNRVDSVHRDTIAVVQKEFGLPVDSFQLVKATIGRNQFLSTILSPYGISPQKLAALAQKSREVFDIRDLRAGKPYTIFCSKDTMKQACYFVYQPNPIDYVVYDLTDSVRIYKNKLPVTTKEKTSSGVITSSMFEALSKVRADPELAIKLADIYAWDIDFYSIQKGDWFKVIYQEHYVNDQPVALGRIKAAVFSHGGNKFYAFYFKDDSTHTEGYYDENAKSLRKAFLKAPLKFFQITSHYTLRRFHPVQHRWKAHLGTDYAAPTGTPIMSTAAGVVIASRYSRFNGNYVKIKHNSVYTTQYLHMSKRAVHVGEHVKQGEVIGYVGSTGLATGPHVCYRFWKNGKQVDPYDQQFPPAEPINKKDLPEFQYLMQREKTALGRVEVPADSGQQPLYKLAHKADKTTDELKRPILAKILSYGTLQEL